MVWALCWLGGASIGFVCGWFRAKRQHRWMVGTIEILQKAHRFEMDMQRMSVSQLRGSYDRVFEEQNKIFQLQLEKIDRLRDALEHLKDQPWLPTLARGMVMEALEFSEKNLTQTKSSATLTP